MCLAYQSGSGTRFKYEHNPMDNPKAARDIIENLDAVATRHHQKLWNLILEKGRDNNV